MVKSTLEKIVDEIFKSEERVTILRILKEQGELNTSAIAHQSQLEYLTVKSHLEFLTKVGVLYRRRFGNIRIYGIPYIDPMKITGKVWERLSKC